MLRPITLHAPSSLSGASPTQSQLNAPLQRVSICLIALTLYLFLPTTGRAAGHAQFEQIAGEAQVVAGAINQTRQNNGLSPLSANSHLIQAAQAHVDDMLAHGNYSHIGSDGSTVGMRVVRSGYGSRSAASENWVAVRSPSQAITWWMNSFPHRANILNSKWREFGVGVRLHPTNGLYYFVAVFGTNEAGSSNHRSYTAPPIKKAAVSPGGTYTVRTGDTLSSIATRFNTSWQQLATINALGNHTLLQVGQQIRLPGATGGPISSTPSIPAANYRGYTIQPGDTLSVVAQLYDTNWEVLAQINGFHHNEVLQVGQIIKIPPSEKKRTTSRSRGASIPELHTVQAGETIIQIALRYDLDWQELLRLNNLSESDLLRLGQKIRLRR